MVKVARLVEALPDPLLDAAFVASVETTAAGTTGERALALALEGVTIPVGTQVASLVALADALAKLPDPEIDPVWADRLERMLLTVDLSTPVSAKVAMVAIPPQLAEVVELARRRPVLRKALIAAIAAALLVALPVAASASALPGSALYGLRLRVEHLHTAWECRSDAVACGFGHLELASHRLNDLEQVIATGNAHWVTPTAHVLRNELSEGTTKILGAKPEPAILHRLNRSLERTTLALTDLMGRAPSPAQAALAEAVGTGRELSGRVVLALGGAAPIFEPPISVVRPSPTVRHASGKSNDSTTTEGKQHKPPTNSYGPGGTPQITPRPASDVYSAGEPMRSECVTEAAGGAPVLDERVCGVVDGGAS